MQSRVFICLFSYLLKVIYFQILNCLFIYLLTYYLFLKFFYWIKKYKIFDFF